MHQRGAQRPKKGVELLSALWTRNSKKAPPEYTDYILCTQVYHCLPSELDRQDTAIVRLHLEFWNTEQRVAEQRQAQKAAAPSRTSGKGQGSSRGRRRR